MILILAALSIVGSRGWADEPGNRKKELVETINRLQSNGSEEDSYMDHPGWHNPTNLLALNKFILAHTNTDEGLVAEVWLSMVATEGERRMGFSNRRIAIAGRIARLNEISRMATNNGTAKCALLTRCMLLFEERDWPAFEAEATNILSKIDSFEAEKDDQFLYLLKANDTSTSEINPMLLYMLMVASCNEGNFQSALQKATQLKEAFPEYSKRNNIENAIDFLKKGKSPYQLLN